jgi:hypothetical protein
MANTSLTAVLNAMSGRPVEQQLQVALFVRN